MRKIVYMYQQHEAPHWFRPAMPADCAVEYWQPGQVYDSDVVFYYDMYGPYHENITQQLAQGHRVIFDAKNEHYMHYRLHWIFVLMLQHPGQGMILISGESAKSIPGVAIVAVPSWYWIMDQQPLMHFGLHEYEPRPDIKHKFLMTIEKIRPDRDYLCDQLGDLLPQSLYSYRHRNVFLPRDWTEDMGGPYQRYVNPEWLDATPFTLIVETYIDDAATSGFSLTNNDHHFLCEKSYKPLAYKHPFIMTSTQGNLAYLRSQGFESFPELFDESYDDIPDWRKRICRVVELVRDFDPRSLDNPRVKEKLLYNSARFFDQQLTQQLLRTTIVEPVLEFVNA
jgi:hypothetical protein